MTNEHDQPSNMAFLGFGGCGVHMLESWQKMLPDGALCIALDRDEKDFHRKKKFKNSVIILAGLGGVIGTWASQLICNRLVAMDKQVVTVLAMPFGFESERMKVAEYALPSFDGAAHRVLCFNDYLIKHTPEHTSMADAFDIMNQKAFDLLNIPQ